LLRAGPPALGNYYLGNYYLLANGLVFFVFFRRFTCARDPRLPSAWPVLELGGAAQGVVDPSLPPRAGGTKVLDHVGIDEQLKRLLGIVW